MKEIAARLLAADSLPGLLSVSFDTFETIRMLARSCEDREPALFAAFMATADAAVDGREAIAAAPALDPPAASPAAVSLSGAASSVAEVADSLADLCVILSERLQFAAGLAPESGDQAACRQAAQAASRIRDLMARGGHDSRPR